jgi:hypothetical protein
MEIKLPPRSLGVREFASGLRIKTSSKLLIQDTGGDIWKGSIGLLAYLEAEIGHALKQMKVLELASGTGALGLSLSLLGVHVMMTDIHTMVPLIRENVEMNSHHLDPGTFGFEVLDWRDTAIPASVADFGPYDLIIASDGTVISIQLVLSPLPRLIQSFYHGMQCSTMKTLSTLSSPLSLPCPNRPYRPRRHRWCCWRPRFEASDSSAASWSKLRRTLTLPTWPRAVLFGPHSARR